MKIEVSHLTRVFGTNRAVDDLSFSFQSGDVIGFVGPNGSGKTTTMSIMATIDEPTAGDVLLDGRSILDFPEESRRRIGFMPDDLPSLTDITVHEYLDFFGRAYGLRGAALDRATAEVEEFTGVTPLRDKTLSALSKGMKQRVSLARALVHDPDLLIMDEPANGLDPRARVELRELVKVLAENGKAVLISSHILTELAEMCSGVVIIEQGRLVSGGDLTDVAASVSAQAPRVLVRALGVPAEALLKILLETPGVASAVPQGPACIATLSTTAAGGVRGDPPPSFVAPPPLPTTASSALPPPLPSCREGELATPAPASAPGHSSTQSPVFSTPFPSCREGGRATPAALAVPPADEALASLLSALLARGLRIVDFHPESLDLEDIFMNVTSGKLA